MIGAKGVTGQLTGSVDAALNDHELIKVKFGEFKEAKRISPLRSPKTPKANLSASSATSPFFTAGIPIREKEKSPCRKNPYDHSGTSGYPDLLKDSQQLN